MSKDVEAQVKVCPDTLDDYNYERFVQDTMLYYTLLPEDCYTLENEGKVTIKKGDEYALLSVQFDCPDWICSRIMYCLWRFLPCRIMK